MILTVDVSICAYTPALDNSTVVEYKAIPLQTIRHAFTYVECNIPDRRQLSLIVISTVFEADFYMFKRQKN